MEKTTLSEVAISRIIVENFMKDIIKFLSVDVAVVGAGPSGLVCAYYLAKQGVKVVVFERQLRVGGGISGGGMMFNCIVVEEEAKEILEKLEITTRKCENNLYVSDALEAASGFCFQAIKAGVKIFNLINVEDVILKKGAIKGLVINWSAVKWGNLHIDPLAIEAKVVVDATGHECEICKIIEKKLGACLNTNNGKVKGEGPMWAEIGEKEVIENTKEVYPGLVVCGMCANAIYGSPRMGAIFGGMLISARKAAHLACQIIGGKSGKDV